MEGDATKMDDPQTPFGKSSPVQKEHELKKDYEQKRLSFEKELEELNKPLQEAAESKELLGKI